MRTVMVRYKVKADRAAENVDYINQVFEQLERETPAGLHYATFRLKDGVSFVHIAAHETGDGSNSLTSLQAFQAFTAGIKDRCEVPPETIELDPLRSYRFFAE
jgi:hypothetical protein